MEEQQVKNLLQVVQELMRNAESSEEMPNVALSNGKTGSGKRIGKRVGTFYFF